MAIEPAGREVSMLLDSAEQEFPGVIELVKAYGNYEETISLVQQYLNMGNEEPRITTSNQSCPSGLY
jgi:hypothetical protein